MTEQPPNESSETAPALAAPASAPSPTEARAAAPVGASAGAQAPSRTGHRSLGPEIVPLLVPLLGVLAGLLGCWLVSWRVGLIVVGGAVALACIERLVLPRRLAGLLVVRGRAFDVIVLGVLAAGLVLMTLARG